MWQKKRIPHPSIPGVRPHAPGMRPPAQPPLGPVRGGVAPSHWGKLEDYLGRGGVAPVVPGLPGAPKDEEPV